FQRAPALFGGLRGGRRAGAVVDVHRASLRIDQRIGGGGRQDGPHGFVGLDEETPPGKLGIRAFQRFHEHALPYEMLCDSSYHASASVPATGSLREKCLTFV